MAAPALTDHIIRQGHAHIRALEALPTIEPSGPFERTLARLLLVAYTRRLRAIVKVVPAWACEHILIASKRIGNQRAPLLMSKN